MVRFQCDTCGRNKEESDVWILGFAVFHVAGALIHLLLVIAVIALIYHHAVPRTQPWHSVLPGATLATGMWLAATLAFGWYVGHYADYSLMYGSLGVGIALLVWMYIVSVIVLIGAEFNAMLFPRVLAERPQQERIDNSEFVVP